MRHGGGASVRSSGRWSKWRVRTTSKHEPEDPALPLCQRASMHSQHPKSTNTYPHGSCSVRCPKEREVRLGAPRGVNAHHWHEHANLAHDTARVMERPKERGSVGGRGAHKDKQPRQQAAGKVSRPARRRVVETASRRKNLERVKSRRPLIHATRTTGSMKTGTKRPPTHTAHEHCRTWYQRVRRRSLVSPVKPPMSQATYGLPMRPQLSTYLGRTTGQRAAGHGKIFDERRASTDGHTSRGRTVGGLADTGSTFQAPKCACGGGYV